MTDDPLEGVKLKIERADSHIGEINDLIDAFVVSNPYEVFPEIDAAKKERYFKVRATKKPPAGIAVICGEVLYGLRSALDHLATCAATKRGRIIIDSTGFPIEQTRKKFETTLHKRKIEERLPALASALKRIEPYQGGTGDLLWWLHWLNGREKHQILVSLAGAQVELHAKLTMTASPEWDHAGTPFFKVPNRWQRLDKETTIAFHPVGLEIDGEIKLEVTVIFGDIETGEPYPIAETLQQMVGAVTIVVRIFEEQNLVG